MKRRETGGNKVFRNVESRLRQIALLVAVLLLNCASPFLERAIDPPGFSGGLGVAAVNTLVPDFDGDPATNSVDVVPGASARYGFDNGFSLSVRAGWGPGWHWKTGSRPARPDFGVVAGFGAKLPVGEAGALKLDLGAMGEPVWNVSAFTPVGSLSYLHDLGQFWTLSASVGFPVLLGMGVVIHPHISDHVLSHISLGTSTLASVGLGLGIDFAGPREPTGN